MKPAYRAAGQAVSRQDFYALACDPQRSVVVEACAGAGKTWMLVSRILRALLDGAQPHEILAITFTRKAAGEMRERLADWLREFGAPACTDAQRIQALKERGVSAAQVPALAAQLQGLHESLLASGRPVEIRTFHAWFAQLLRAAPLDLLAELGLQPEVELIESLDDHLDDVHRRFHAALLRDEDLRAEHAQLIAQRGRSQARKWLDTVLNRRVEIELADAAGTLDDSVPPAAALWPDLEGLSHPADQLERTAWQAQIRSVAAALGRSGKKLQLAAADALLLALAQHEPAARHDALRRALFTDKGGLRKLGDHAELAALQVALEQLAEQVRQHDAHEEHVRLVRLSRVLLAEYATYKRQRGLADMADLERCALALLRDGTLSGWVQERLDARIRHVLIDEFQDTSPLQWHALHAWLSAYAGAGGGASGQRPPALFIVGDPKQSIYRFRRAEPRVFEAARAFVVEALGGCVLECDHTRRNAPAVLEALNTVFTAAQDAGEFAGFRAHTTEVEMDAASGVHAFPQIPRPERVRASRDAEEEPVWRDSLTTPRHEAEEVLREQEAAQVARCIHALLQRGEATPGDVLVLCRKRESLRLVAQALRERHVPHAAAEDAALAEAPEVLDLIALLDVLASPRHRLSLARALRSPLFGVSDAELLSVALGAGAWGDWWQSLVDRPHASVALERARHLLPPWQAIARQLPPHDLLDRIVGEGELRERLAASVPPERRVAALDAVDALLAQALQLDGARYATPYNLVRALKHRRIDVTPPTHADAVQLLTVHGAKGLEARVVFVMDADPEARNADTATLLVDWPVEMEHPQRCAFVYSESNAPVSLHTLLAHENAARRREELNGLYVAMTRARERLVFSATAPLRSSGSAPSWWARVAPVMSPWGQEIAAGETGAVSTPEPITLPVLPSLPLRPAPTAAEPVAPETPATRLGQAVHRVLEWATTAGQGTDIATLADGAAAEFGAPAGEVERLAQAMLGSRECAPFFSGPALRWAGNEVPIAADGQPLRIDRLVQIEEADGALTWWVLDYKLQPQPQDLPANCEQLLRYRDAVRRAEPGAVVRCAFITGTGRLIELD
jgi:ATP-dependent helicase/nuclease subunit A